MKDQQPTPKDCCAEGLFHELSIREGDMFETAGVNEASTSGGPQPGRLLHN